MDELSKLARIWKRAARAAATDKQMDQVFNHDAICPLPQLAYAFALLTAEEDCEWSEWLTGEEARTVFGSKVSSDVKKRAGHALARAALDPDYPAPPVVTGLARWLLGERSLVGLAHDMLLMDEYPEELAAAWWQVALPDVALRFFKKYPVLAGSSPAQVSEEGAELLHRMAQRARECGRSEQEIRRAFAPIDPWAEFAAH